VQCVPALLRRRRVAWLWHIFSFGFVRKEPCPSGRARDGTDSTPTRRDRPKPASRPTDRGARDVPGGVDSGGERADWDGRCRVGMGWEVSSRAETEWDGTGGVESGRDGVEN
jgi:hypothetical protein